MDTESGDGAGSFITDRDSAILRCTTDIVCAAFAGGRLEPAKGADLVIVIDNALRSCLNGHVTDEPVQAGLPANDEPTVEKATEEQIRASITPDYLVSFEDGKHYKTLKRNLKSRGLSPEQYRAKWGLPHDYPMVAETYSAQRSVLAKNLGLGRRDQPEAELPR